MVSLQERNLEEIINLDLNFKNLKQELEDHNFLRIENFLNNDFADELYTYLNDEISDDWWFSVSKPKDLITFNDSISFDQIRNLPQNADLISLNKERVKQAFDDGFFAYIYQRTLQNHFPDCGCLLCQFIEFLQSPIFCNHLSEISGLEINENLTMFATKYIEGDFLAPHHDKDLGTLGFTLQLTKEWKSHYGGLLFFTNQNGDKIDDVYIPKFNVLTLFNLPTGKGHTHHVSPVVKKPPMKRLSMTGWFGPDGSNKRAKQCYNLSDNIE